MTKTHHKHPYRKIAFGLVLMVGILLAGHLLLPYVVNMQGVRERILAHSARAISGDVDFGTIRPVLLPIPHVEIDQISVTVPNKFDLRFPRLIISPKLWPLLTGTLEIDHLKLVEPDVRLLQFFEKVDRHQPPDHISMPPIQDRLSDALIQVVGVLGHFDAEIVAGRLSAVLAGRSQILLSDLDGRFGTAKDRMHIDMRGNSRLFNGFDLAGDIDLQTLNSSGRLSLMGFRTEGFKALGVEPIAGRLPQTVMDLDVTFKSKGPGQVQARFAVHAPAVTLVNGTRQLVIEKLSIVGRADWRPQQTDVVISRLQMISPKIQLSGSLKWITSKSPPPTMPIRITFNGNDLNVSQIRDAVLRLYGDHPVVRNVLNIVRSGTIPSLAGEVTAGDWSDLKMMDQLRVECDLVEGRIMVPKDLLDLQEVSGRVLIAKGRLSAHKVSARFGNTSAKKGKLILGLFDSSRAFFLDALVDADLAQLPMVLHKLMSSKHRLAQLDQLPSVNGRVSGRLILGDRLDRLTAQISAASHIKTADSAFELMGTISDLPSARTSARLFVKGQLGAKMVNWLWSTTEAPPEYSLKTPFVISGADIMWRSSGRLDLIGSLERADGLRATAAMTAHKGDFHLERLHVKEGASDALFSIHRQNAGKRLDLGFQGVVEKSAMDKLFRKNRLLGGQIKGRFQAHFDHAEPERTTLHGQLSVRQLEIPLGGPIPMRIINASVHGLNNRFAVPSMSLKWDDQAMQLSGKGLFSREALDLEVSLVADALNAEKIIPVFNAKNTGANRQSAKASVMRPIRVKGMVDIDRLDYGRYRIAPFRAAIEHGEKKTQVGITTADLCGIQAPGRIIILPDGTVNMALQPKVIRSELEAASTCLLDVQHTERLEGIVDLNGKVNTHGKSNGELISNLRGSVDLRIEKGRIYNVGSAGLFTNLLSFLSVNQYVSGDFPDLSKNDFHYNRIESQLVFRDGMLFIKEGIVKSNSVNMVADGQYQLISKNLDLQMLVSPLTTVDWIVERIPIIGNILGGTLVAIPVRVKGHQSDPQITPLAFSSVGSRLWGILKRVVNTPVRIIKPLLKDNSEKKSSQE